MKGIVTLYSNDKEVIKRMAINKLKFKEKLIVEKSIELFNDHDPCIIHSTMCINKLAFELLEELSKDSKIHLDVIYKLNEAINLIVQKVDFDSDVYFLSVK